MDTSFKPSPVSIEELLADLAGTTRPLVIDVRREATYLAENCIAYGALRRDPALVAQWAAQLPREARVVVMCAHGLEIGVDTAAALNAHGIDARFVAGGLQAWQEAGGSVMRKPANASTRWVTRERPKIDRIACPWLIRRFVDPGAEFLYVPTGEVRTVAHAQDAMPYDVTPKIATTVFTHDGAACSFDAFIKHYGLQHDPALMQLATIVRGADTDHVELAPQAAGLLAISLGLSRLFSDDHIMLAQGVVLYDALYRWCKEGQSEVHTWNPAAY